jgi:hypothetical protein
LNGNLTIEKYQARRRLLDDIDSAFAEFEQLDEP